MGSLDNQSVVIIGGTSGIGLATAIAARDAGAKVWAASRSGDKVNACREAHAKIEFAQVDTHDVGALNTLFDQAGSIDHIVGAATGADRTIAPFLEQTDEQFREAFNKFWGYTHVARNGIPRLADQGSLTLVSGSPARKSNPGMSSISCTGGAVEAFVRAIAIEVAPRRVNVVAPGLISTGMFDHFGDKKEETLGAMSKGLPLGRAGRPEEVAAAILLCMTNGYMTGNTVDVDGGTLLP